jgi:predicted outer membrane protein
MRSASDPRQHRAGHILVLLVVLVMSQLAVPVLASAQTATLSASDRDLLNRVRQAGLWEMPAGDMARTRAENPHVRDVGMTLMVDHGRLDVQVRDLAAKYGVVLPDQPTADQQSWLNEMRNATSSSDFERIFANRLRAAHGTVFGVIAQVRAGTRNDEIRAFAATANQVVLRHITLLESTGLVDYNQLPQPTVNTTSATSAASALDLGSMDVLVTVVLVLLLCGATLLGLWLIRNSVRRRTRSGDKHASSRNPEPEREPAA